MTAADVAAVIAGHRFTYANENQLQAGIAAALTEAGYAVRREVRLNSRDRIDILAGPVPGPWVGVEVKLTGQPAAVMRQLQRYAHHSLVGELVLVTRRAAHLMLPATVVGKPLTVVQLSGVV